MAEKQRERVRQLKEGSKSGTYILYWMQASARVEQNHALEYAVHLSNQRKLPLLVFFVITPEFPDATLRHYWFMIQGLQDVTHALEKRKIPFHLYRGNPPEVATELAAEADALVLDRGYLRIQREWPAQVRREVGCDLYQVESNVVVPVEVASEKEEYTAATLRPKINRHLHRFLKPIDPLPLTIDSSDLPGDLPSLDGKDGAGIVSLEALRTPEAVLKEFPRIAAEPGPVSWIHGGSEAARVMLKRFCEERLDNYEESRNDPAQDGQSNLSPYLHFGQISPIAVALEAQKSGGNGVGAFLEELIIRRELSMNFCRYNDAYDSYDALPEWARKSMSEHLSDKRPYTYDLATLEKGETDDPYWNAAQLEMVKSGNMHGYMRMYWGKKLLEWSGSPRDAFGTALYLNNKYELDGRDPNGFAGVAWCFGKHDRGWPERKVFGKVRYMNANGLRRKFKQIDQYVDRWTKGSEEE